MKNRSAKEKQDEVRGYNRARDTIADWLLSMNYEPEYSWKELADFVKSECWDPGWKDTQ